uniref:Uncharacterized protein n=1 Tax=Timema cristinae TaxID=61476 RepID=A0A7R9CIM6_TIMCR|nr:unnamed protein product [Timema cristinae]
MSTEPNATSSSDIETKEQNEIDILTVNVLTQEVTLTSETVNSKSLSYLTCSSGGHRPHDTALQLNII